MRGTSITFLVLAVIGCGNGGRPADGGQPSAPDLGVAPGGVGDGNDLGGGGGDGGVTAPQCPSPVAADPLVGARLSCTFAAGALPRDTVGLSDAARAQLPIKHIVVMMKENRSFDQIFGGLKTLQHDAEVFPATFSNKDKGGNVVTPVHLDTTCLNYDPDHQWQHMHDQVNNGMMDGFVTSAANTTGSDGHFALGYYDQFDLPFYYFLANTFAIADHYFPSVRSGTFPNRDYMLLGTSDVVDSTQFSTWPDPKLPTIFDRLDAAGVSWGVYGDDHPLEETLNNPAHNFEKLYAAKWKPVHALIDAFAQNSVPSVVFVDARENREDEHPTADVQLGEKWSKAIYDAAVASDAWRSTA